MSFTLVSLLIVASASIAGVFYYMITYQVEQSIAMGFVKNLDIQSRTLASIKQNEWEIVGNDLSVTAGILTDLISDPECSLQHSL